MGLRETLVKVLTADLMLVPFSPLSCLLMLGAVWLGSICGPVLPWHWKQSRAKRRSMIGIQIWGQFKLWRFTDCISWHNSGCCAPGRSRHIFARDLHVHHLRRSPSITLFISQASHLPNSPNPPQSAESTILENTLSNSWLLHCPLLYPVS